MLPLIVLAEDNSDLRGLLASALEAIGYRVAQAETGAHLLELVRSLRERGEVLQLIITDVRMPTIGGVEAARALREAGDDTALILMTAYGDAWTRAQAAELGATLLDKPLRLDVLRNAVKQLIGS